MFSVIWQPRVSKYYWLNWQWAESHRSRQNRHSDMEHTLQSRITAVFFFFVNCFLNICKCIIVFLCFSTVKKSHTAPLMPKHFLFSKCNVQRQLKWKKILLVAQKLCTLKFTVFILINQTVKHFIYAFIFLAVNMPVNKYKYIIVNTFQHLFIY